MFSVPFLFYRYFKKNHNVYFFTKIVIVLIRVYNQMHCHITIVYNIPIEGHSLH